MLKLSQIITIALAPLYIIRWHFLVPTTLLEVMILTTLALTLVDMWRNKVELVRLRTPLDLPIGLLLISAVIALIYSPDVIGGLGILKAFFLEPILFYYSLVYVARKDGQNHIILGLMLSGVWLLGLAVVQKITNGWSLAPYEIAQGRIPALYNSANSLALYLGPIILVGLASWYLRLKWRWLIFVFILGECLVMLWTKSRGGVLALIYALAVFFYGLAVGRWPILGRMKWLGLILTMVMVVGFFATVYLDYNSSPVPFVGAGSNTDTLQSRYFIWIGTLSLLRDHPILGAGLNGFSRIYGQTYRVATGLETFQYPHNLILTVWVEMGLFGLVAFSWLLVVTISLIYTKIKSGVDYLAAACLAIMAFILIHGLVDVPYFKNDLSLEFWVIMALIAIGNRKEIKGGR